MPNTSHTSRDFDVDLDRVRARVLEMGGIAEYQVRYALEALRTGDARHIGKVVAEESRVNAMELEIDALVAQLIAKRTPTANDLRFILGVSKVVTDLERIGDEAKKIALLAQRLPERGRLRSGYAEVAPAAETVIDMLRRALDGFARLDESGAVGIQREDETVDEHLRDIERRLLARMIEDPRIISAAIDLVFVAKALERIGDHAKNIAEHVVFAVKGHDVRHASIADMEKALGR